MKYLYGAKPGEIIYWRFCGGRHNAM